jgi:hypothetical protein
VGCGDGFSGDRTDAALPVVRTLIARGGPVAIMFENLAERTLLYQTVAEHYETCGWTLPARVNAHKAPRGRALSMSAHPYPSPHPSHPHRPNDQRMTSGRC